MKFLKGFALGLWGSLLFLSLSVFGLAFTLNSTILSPDFVTAEQGKLDISSLAEEFFGEETIGFRTALVDTIAGSETSLKEQASAATYSVYDYLLGKSQNLDLALVLSDTILNADFVASMMAKPNIASLAGEFLAEQIAEENPEEMAEVTEYVGEAVAELEPWGKEQTSIAIGPISDYLLGRNQSLSVIISLEPVKENLEVTLKKRFLESPPAEHSGLSVAQLEQYFDKYIGEIPVEVMPLTFEIDESMLGIEIPAQIAEALAMAEHELEQVRQYVGYFQLGYNLLLGFIGLLILGIILINREVRTSTRGLGITFLTYGAAWYGGNFAIKYCAVSQTAQLLQLGPSSPLQMRLPLLFSDFLAPLQMYSLGFLAAGAVLLMVSFVYKLRQPSD